jgi:hypothetical protein
MRRILHPKHRLPFKEKSKGTMIAKVATTRFLMSARVKVFRSSYGHFSKGDHFSGYL